MYTNPKFKIPINVIKVIVEKNKEDVKGCK